MDHLARRGSRGLVVRQDLLGTLGHRGNLVPWGGVGRPDTLGTRARLGRVGRMGQTSLVPLEWLVLVEREDLADLVAILDLRVAQDTLVLWVSGEERVSADLVPQDLMVGTVLTVVSSGRLLCGGRQEPQERTETMVYLARLGFLAEMASMAHRGLPVLEFLVGLG